MQSVLNHVSYRSSHPTGKRRKKDKKFYQRLVDGGYYTALSYIIHDVFVLFTFHLLKRKLK